MEILSSLRFFKIILAIFSIALFSNCLAAQEHDVLPKQTSSRRGLSSCSNNPFQIPTAATSNSINSMSGFLNYSRSLKRASFPSHFLFGAASSAIQIEGAAHEGGRGPGLWDDRFQHNKRQFIDGDKFYTMIEHYKRYKEDVQHLKRLGVNSYRMSISWSRILPDGTLEGGINQEGIDFYNNLINELLENGITPFVTILHFDYPLALQQKLGGFFNRSIVNHFKDYSELLFKTYGDRVKYWTTVNEPEVVALFTYMHDFNDKGIPQPCQVNKKNEKAYIVLHNFLLAHAAAAHLYKKKFQAKQGGKIGLVLSSHGFIPYSSKVEDVAAAQRLKDFYLGWVLEPLFHGKYPKIMVKVVGDRLPKFKKKERKMIKGSVDFLGINYYNSYFAKHEPNVSRIVNVDSCDASATSQEINAEGKTLGYKDEYGYIYVYPDGLYDVLLYIKEKYHSPTIYITENGVGSTKLSNPLNDEHKIAYITAHLNTTKTAINNGINIGGYFVWAAFDTFEFQAGYSQNWGLYHVNFNDNLKRVPKASAKWYRKFLTANNGHS